MRYWGTRDAVGRAEVAAAPGGRTLAEGKVAAVSAPGGKTPRAPIVHLEDDAELLMFWRSLRGRRLGARARAGALGGEDGDDAMTTTARSG